MLRAQAPVPVTLTVEDNSGGSIAGASVKEAAGALLGRTGTDGHLTVQCQIPCPLRVDAEGFKGKFVEVSAKSNFTPAAAVLEAVREILPLKSPDITDQNRELLK